MSTIKIDAKSPSEPCTGVLCVRLNGPLHVVERIDVEATLRGAEGGDLDVSLEERIGPDMWRERVSLGRVCAGALEEVRLRSFSGLDTGEFRLVLVAGEGTTNGTSATIKITPHARVVWN